ncbi:hypothetical protein [Alkalihalobacterium bogoriense]|uniref:hypothetical protein n=1 Tax=Alkalihalobacterium bogoriense TaxID=246272 RepID=UPI00047A3527|nr:hypothetical protein [Alkalihalobacterium bogoriense]
MRSKKNHDQAEELRKQVDEWNQTNHEPDIDVSTLPPRSEVHKRKSKNQSNKKAVRFPLIELLLFLFLLIIIFILVGPHLFTR